MKKSELRKIIKEEISKVINEKMQIASLEDIGDEMFLQPETGIIFGIDGVAEVQMNDYGSEQDYELALQKSVNLLRKAGHDPEAITHSWMTLIKI